MDTSTIKLASLENIITSITTIAAWFWGLFSKFVAIIAENDLILWSVILSFTAAALFGVIWLVRKFGLKSRR